MRSSSPVILLALLLSALSNNPALCAASLLPAPYHSTDALLAAIRTLAGDCPHLLLHRAHIHDPSSTSGTGSLPFLTLSANAKALPPSLLAARPALLATFGEHGRERITSELALHILHRYCAPTATFPPSSTLTRFRLVLVPLANAAGRLAVERGSPCVRTNGHGVDLNRNYLLHWGVRDAGTLRVEEPPGRAPLSELEARAIDAIAQRTRPLAYLSVHSGDTAVLYPWDHGGPVVVEDGLHRVRALARMLRRAHCAGECPVGTARVVFRYRAYGTAADHVFGVLGVPFVYTLEIFGDAGAGVDECARMFNPLTTARFDEVMRNWTGVFDTLASGLGVLGADVNAEALRRQRAARWRGSAEDAARIRRGYQVQFSDDATLQEVHRASTFVSAWWIVAVFGLLSVWGIGHRRCTKTQGEAEARRGWPWTVYDGRLEGSVGATADVHDISSGRFRKTAKVRWGSV